LVAASLGLLLVHVYQISMQKVYIFGSCNLSIESVQINDGYKVCQWLASTLPLLLEIFGLIGYMLV